MAGRIRDTSRRGPRIVHTGPTQPRVDPRVVAAALGAEIVGRSARRSPATLLLLLARLVEVDEGGRVAQIF